MASNFQLLLNGFGVFFTMENVFAAFAGAILGLCVGAMPGIGSLAGVALLLPLTYKFNPTTAIIMLGVIVVEVVPVVEVEVVVAEVVSEEVSSVVDSVVDSVVVSVVDSVVVSVVVSEVVCESASSVEGTVSVVTSVESPPISSPSSLRTNEP